MDLLIQWFEKVAPALVRHSFAILALLPGAIAIFNHLIAVERRFVLTEGAIATVKAAAPGLASSPAIPRPSRTYTLLGAIGLTLVFEIVAAFGGGGILTRTTDLGPHSGVLTMTSEGAKQTERKAEESKEVSLDALDGLVFAGYGAFVYCLTLLISRLNLSALTGKFLVTSSIRAAITLVFGFVAAATGVFSGVSRNQGLFALFLLGLFPSWAFNAVREKAISIFKPPLPGSQGLPLKMVDGLDDGMEDCLVEFGITDVENLSASDPLVVSAQTLFPVRRVLDWMDQALLLVYVRESIVHFRACAVRGAIDLAALYRDAMALGQGGPVLRARAVDVLNTISKKSGMADATLLTIGRNLYEDALVTSIWTLWQQDPESPEAVPGSAPLHTAQGEETHAEDSPAAAAAEELGLYDEGEVEAPRVDDGESGFDEKPRR